MTDLGLPSVSNHLKKVQRDGLVRKERGSVYSNWIASESELFKAYKRNDTLIQLVESGLIQFLVDDALPDVIVLFGSASRGEDIETSDIDLFLVASEKN